MIFFQTWLLVVAAEKLFQEMMLDFGIYLELPSCDWPITVDFLQKMTKSNFIQIENMTWLNSQRVDKPNYNGHNRLNNSQDFANLIYHFSEMGQNRKRFVKTLSFLRTLLSDLFHGHKKSAQIKRLLVSRRQKSLICHYLCTTMHSKLWCNFTVKLSTIFLQWFLLNQLRGCFLPQRFIESLPNGV